MNSRTLIGLVLVMSFVGSAFPRQQGKVKPVEAPKTETIVKQEMAPAVEAPKAEMKKDAAAEPAWMSDKTFRDKAMSRKAMTGKELKKAEKIKKFKDASAEDKAKWNTLRDESKNLKTEMKKLEKKDPKRAEWEKAYNDKIEEARTMFNAMPDVK